MHNTTRKEKNISGKKDFNITFETTVKLKNRETSIKSKINGLDSLTMVYNSKAADLLASYSLIQKDLKFCKKNLLMSIKLSGGDLNSSDSVYLRDEVDENADILKALTISFIITYGKCFTQADGRKAKLESREMFKNNLELRQIHDFLMDQRNNYIAHSGLTNSERAKTLIILDSDESKRENPKLTTSSTHIYSFEQTGYEYFLKVVKHLDNQLVSLINKRVKKIQNGELKKVSDAYLYELARNNKPLCL